MERGNHAHSWLGDTLRAHTLQFERPLTPTYGHAVGSRILVSFLVVGIGLFIALRSALNAAGVGGLPVAKDVSITESNERHRIKC